MLVFNSVDVVAYEALISKHFAFLQSLASGLRVPVTSAQKDFVEFSKGCRFAVTQYEFAWLWWSWDNSSQELADSRMFSVEWVRRNVEAGVYDVISEIHWNLAAAAWVCSGRCLLPVDVFVSNLSVELISARLGFKNCSELLSGGRWVACVRYDEQSWNLHFIFGLQVYSAINQKIEAECERLFNAACVRFGQSSMELCDIDAILAEWLYEVRGSDSVLTMIRGRLMCIRDEVVGGFDRIVAEGVYDALRIYLARLKSLVRVWRLIDSDVELVEVVCEIDLVERVMCAYNLYDIEELNRVGGIVAAAALRDIKEKARRRMSVIATRGGEHRCACCGAPEKYCSCSG